MPKAKINEININYKVEGQGEPLIMIMGFAGRRRSWIFQTRAFNKYYRVVTFDNRGVGKTDKPDGPYTIKMMADDTIGLMDYLDIDRAHILGVSMGGMIAQEIAINHPDRVNKLALGCTYASIETTPEAIKVAELFGSGGAGIWKGLSALCSLAINKRLLRTILLLVFWIHAISDGPRGLVGQSKALLSHNTLDRLNMIETPTLVITGTADRLITPGSSDVIANLITNARLVKIENGSHVFFVETKGRFNEEVLDFFKKTQDIRYLTEECPGG